MAKLTPPGLTAALKSTSVECHQIDSRRYEILNQTVLPQLSAIGIRLLRNDDRTQEQRAWIKAFLSRKYARC